MRHHFGSEDALLALVYREALREFFEVQGRRFDELPDDASLEDLVRVWLALSSGLPRPVRGRHGCGR